MEKSKIYRFFESAIQEVSPYAAQLLNEKMENKVEDICLIDIGVNSIDYAEVVSMVMAKLGVYRPLDIFTRTNRLTDVINILHEISSEQVVVA